MSRPVIRFIVSIDTEEDNWAPSRTGITTKNIRELPALERRFESLGVRATYFTTYQVALEPSSAAIMREIAATGRSEIGAHLHPWNTPPLLNKMQTMLVNIALEVQAKKLATLTQQLGDSLGTVPRAFRAGRFGLGAATVQALIASGYAVDSSVTPFFSWESSDRGPSFVGAPLHMYRLSGNNDVRVPDGGPLVEAPLSSGYNRWHPDAWPVLHRRLNTGLANTFLLSAVAARLGIARRVILSPEPYDTGDLCGLAGSLLDGGLPFLHVFWHSSSMVPGLTTFSRSPADVQRLWGRFEVLLEWLDQRVSLRFVTVSEAVAELGVAPTIKPVPAPTLPPPPMWSGIPSPDTTEVYSLLSPEVTPTSVAAADLKGPSLGNMRRHTAIYLTGILIGRAVSFVMLPFYTHYLTPADYGIMQLLEMTLDVLSIMAGTRIASGIHRYYFKAENEADRQAVLSTAVVLLAVSFVAFGALIFIFAEPLTTLVLGNPQHADLMRIAAVTFAFQGLVLVPFAIVQLWKRSVLYTVLSTGKLLVQLALNIVLLAVVGLGVRSVFLSTLAGNLVIGGILTVLVIRQVGLHWSGTAARSLLRYGLPLVGTQFATFFVTYGDRYFLRVNGDVTQVGLYSLAYQFGFIVASIGYLPFSMVWEPTRFQVANRPDRDALYSRAFIFMNMVLLIATVGCALFVRDFIIVMSAQAYHQAYLIVPIILAAYVLQSWAHFHEVGILVKEQTRYITLANWVAALVAFAGYAVLVPRWLGWGAAITTVLAFLVRWIITYVVAQRLLPVQYEWGPVWRAVGISAAFIVAGVLLPHPGVVSSVLMRSALFVGYCVALWHLGLIAPSEKAQLIQAARSPRSAVDILMGSR